MLIITSNRLSHRKRPPRVKREVRYDPASSKERDRTMFEIIRDHGLAETTRKEDLERRFRDKLRSQGVWQHTY